MTILALTQEGACYHFVINEGVTEEKLRAELRAYNKWYREVFRVERKKGWPIDYLTLSEWLLKKGLIREVVDEIIELDYLD